MRWIDKERGATAVVVALLMVPLIGFVAISVDVAAAYAERQQLQNGVDAAALAIAQECALNGCPSTPETIADSMVAGNNNYGAIDNVAVDMSKPGRATVTAIEAEKNWFAPLLSSSFGATTVTADATSNWGGIGSTKSLPLIFSACVIENYIKTVGNSFIFEAGRYKLASSPSAIVTINAVTNGGGNIGELSKGCTLQGTGHFNPTPPGGFGVITEAGTADCDVATTVNEPVLAGQGANLGGACTFQTLVDIVNSGEPIAIPVHNGHSGNGNGATYNVYGHVGFRLTGFGLNLGGSDKTYGTAGCSGSGNNKQCITGQFVTLVDADAELDPTAPNLGSFTFKLID
jgi:hypothetical protein